VTGADAVLRISDGLGFRTGIDQLLLRRLQEAQKSLESGKTLPRFLLQEDQSISISGSNVAALPTDFIRMDESELVKFIDPDTGGTKFVKPVNSLAMGLEAFKDSTSTIPLAVLVRKATLYFFPTTLTAPFTFTWSYYKRAAVIALGSENEWLGNKEGGAEWLIGEAGSRAAGDLGNARKQFFDAMALKGRADLFGEIIEKEMQSGPVIVGADN